MTPKQSVLTYLQSLPVDKVTTYSALATKFDTHPRAIATYMRTNKELDIYPCYKVVAKDGRLSGYVLGIPEKIRRLTADGIHIHDGKVDDRYILRDFS